MNLTRLGKGMGTDDKIGMRAHLAYLKMIKMTKPDVVIHENVPQYDVTWLKKNMPYAVEFDEAELDPRRFGIPMARKRKYRVMNNKQKTRRSYKDRRISGQ